jgi:surface antigen
LPLGLAQAPQCGQVLATYKGVPAFSNNGDQWTGESCAGRGTDGLQYQCVEYVRRFYATVFGVNTKVTAWNGDASIYYNTAAERGLAGFPNGGTVPPQPDDIVVFQGGKYGHVAVVTEVEATRIHIVEQNWSLSGTFSLALTVSSGRYAVSQRGRYRVVGWLRRSCNSYLSFTTGNPGVPGDGVFVGPSPDSLLFVLSQAYPLTGVTNGVTLTVFPARLDDKSPLEFDVFFAMREHATHWLYTLLLMTEACSGRLL